MALVASTLASSLESLTPSADEATSITRLVDAWADYFGGATVSGAPLVAGSVSAGLSAMASALVGMSGSGQGATKLAAAVTAFWAAQTGLATSMWVTAPIVLVPPIIVPTGLGSLESNLTAVFTDNTVGSLSLSSACANIADVLHNSGGVGGTVPGSVPPAPPAAIPIL